MRWLAAMLLVLALSQVANSASSVTAPGRPPPIHDHQLFWFFLLDQVEYRQAERTEAIAWDASGWVGGDFHRLWLKTEGERNISNGEGGEFEVQALYGYMVSPFWDLQAGVRHDRSLGKGPNGLRTFAVFGAQGTAPYWFELQPALFLSEDGDVSFRLSGEYELLLTQRLVLAPTFEVNAAWQEVREFGVGRGLNDLELGLRVRCEVRREFAPYLGVVWKRALGATAGIVRQEGEEVTSTSLVAGLRLWF